MLQFRNSKLFCLLFMLIVFYSMNGMLGSSDLKTKWKTTTNVSTLCKAKIVEFSSLGNYAFVGGTKSLAQLLALKKGMKASEDSYRILGLKNVVSAVFDPREDQKKVAVVDDKGLNFVEFEDCLGGIGVKTQLILSNAAVRGDDQFEFVKYNDEGTALILGSSFGTILVYSADSGDVIYQHKLKDCLYSLQSLPEQFFPGDQLLLGGGCNVYFCTSDRCQRKKNKFHLCRVTTCFDKKSVRLIERIDLDDNSFVLSSIDSENLSKEETYKDSEMKVTMNTSKGEVLLIEHTDPSIITDVDFNPIAIFPKEHDIAKAILSNDGHRLATIDSTGHIVRFWQNV